MTDTANQGRGVLADFRDEMLVAFGFNSPGFTARAPEERLVRPDLGVGAFRGPVSCELVKKLQEDLEDGMQGQVCLAVPTPLLRCDPEVQARQRTQVRRLAEENRPRLLRVLGSWKAARSRQPLFWSGRRSF